jgi:hypothetical protein
MTHWYEAGVVAGEIAVSSRIGENADAVPVDR